MNPPYSRSSRSPETRSHALSAVFHPLLLAVVLTPILLFPSASSGFGGEGIPARSGEVLTLAASLDAASRCSLELKEARESLITKEFSMQTANAGYWPKVAASVDYVLKDKYGEGEPSPVRPYLAVSNTTFNEWEKVRETKTALADLYAAKLAHEQARLSVLLLAGEKHFNLLMAQELAVMSGAAAESRRRDLLEQESKFKLGLVPEISVVRARASMIRSMTELRSREGEWKMAQQALGTVLCLPRENPPLAVGNLWAKEIPGRETSRELGLRNSPELRIQREALAQMGDLGESVKWTRWPQLGAQAFLGYNPYDFNNKTNWTFIVTASQNLFDGGAARQRIEATNSEVRKLRVEVARKEKEISDKIDMLYLDLEVCDNLLSSVGEQQELANRMIALTKKGFDLGAFSYKELQDALSVAGDQVSAVSMIRARKRTIEFKIMLLTGLLGGPEANSWEEGAGARDRRTDSGGEPGRREAQ